MKKRHVNFSAILSFFRNWLHKKETNPQPTVTFPVSTPKEVLHLCCNMVRKKEMYVRTQAKRLNPYTIEKVLEPNTPLRAYKGLRVESQEYALWCEFFNPDGKPRTEKTYLYCQTVLLFFHNNALLYDFLNALGNEDQFQCFWDHCWLYLEEEHVKISLEISKTCELPHCLIFSVFN